ncbi:hypothetical protein CFAM422_010959 [Trichoderma lentiforme]|uniref:Uncharacterized protein n=1 Tax=Trichoderma lentiforme TaxID=1567552 RepID=A0A9P4X818_9HYPO|nr:hypothetical protein CFAM422_010959 [Trichoderma lentiforme]
MSQDRIDRFEKGKGWAGLWKGPTEVTGHQGSTVRPCLVFGSQGVAAKSSQAHGHGPDVEAVLAAAVEIPRRA